MALKGKIYSLAKQYDDLNTNELFQSMIDESSTDDVVVMDGRNLAAGSIYSEQIHAGAITADKIRADAINADHINVGSLSALSTNIGEITAGIIRSKDNGIHINLNTGIIDLSKPLTINNLPVSTKKEVEDAIQDIEVGGRNLLKGTSDSFEEINPRTRFTSLPENSITPISEYRLKAGDTITFKMYIQAHNSVPANARITHYYTSGSGYGNVVGNRIQAGEEGYSTVTYTITSDVDRLEVGLDAPVPAGDTSILMYYKEAKLEKGNKVTDWTPAPEDVDSKVEEVNERVDVVNEELEDKANNIDITNLGTEVSDIASQVARKVDEQVFEESLNDYNRNINNLIRDKDSLAEQLGTIEGRTKLIEIIAEESKLVTTFIDTVITESDEGIFIGSQSERVGVLISNERISFMDGGSEVAYISNQTMMITHGIFVESAVISSFKFEKIPNTEILAITWAGNN